MDQFVVFRPRTARLLGHLSPRRRGHRGGADRWDRHRGCMVRGSAFRTCSAPPRIRLSRVGGVGAARRSRYRSGSLPARRGVRGVGAVRTCRPASAARVARGRRLFAVQPVGRRPAATRRDQRYGSSRCPTLRPASGRHGRSRCSRILRGHRRRIPLRPPNRVLDRRVRCYRDSDGPRRRPARPRLCRQLRRGEPRPAAFRQSRRRQCRSVRSARRTAVVLVCVPTSSLAALDGRGRGQPGGSAVDGLAGA